MRAATGLRSTALLMGLALLMATSWPLAARTLSTREAFTPVDGTFRDAASLSRHERALMLAQHWGSLRQSDHDAARALGLDLAPELRALGYDAHTLPQARPAIAIDQAAARAALEASAGTLPVRWEQAEGRDWRWRLLTAVDAFWTKPSLPIRGAVLRAATATDAAIAGDLPVADVFGAWTPPPREQDFTTSSPADVLTPSGRVALSGGLGVDFAFSARATSPVPDSGNAPSLPPAAAALVPAASVTLETLARVGLAPSDAWLAAPREVRVRDGGSVVTLSPLSRGEGQSARLGATPLASNVSDVRGVAALGTLPAALRSPLFWAPRAGAGAPLPAAEGDGLSAGAYARDRALLAYPVTSVAGWRWSGRAEVGALASGTAAGASRAFGDDSAHLFLDATSSATPAGPWTHLSTSAARPLPARDWHVNVRVDAWAFGGPSTAGPSTGALGLDGLKLQDARVNVNFSVDPNLSLQGGYLYTHASGLTPAGLTMGTTVSQDRGFPYLGVDYKLSQDTRWKMNIRLYNTPLDLSTTGTSRAFPGLVDPQLTTEMRVRF